MSEISLADLRTLMRQYLRNDDSSLLDGDFGDIDFTDLGYDSLARLELLNLLERHFGVDIPDAVSDELLSPREVVDFINRGLAKAEA